MQSESVQYFQFDSMGNMYVYPPGAGCTGELKLLKPGDEMIYNSKEEDICVSQVENCEVSVAQVESPQICQTSEKVTSSRCAFKTPLHIYIYV